MAKLNTDILDIFSCVVDKGSYLKCLDLGRVLLDSSRALLQHYRQQHQTEYAAVTAVTAVTVVGEGLSARAIEDNALHFIALYISLVLMLHR